MEHPIGALPRTPFPASRDFPSRGNERYEGKTESHILHVPLRHSPFGTAYHLSARKWWHNKPQIPVELSPHPLQIYNSFTSHCIIM